jgi:uncharacterized membrane protein
MDLSQEERRKIYEEEKARVEAQEQAEKKKNQIPPESSTTIAPRVAGFLCYLGVWISGIVFFVIEQKNKWVRFHAAQSLLTFGTLWVAGMILGNIPYVKFFFGPVLTILGIILWIVLMVKAYNGERFKLPFFGDIAEMMIGNTAGSPPNTPPANPPAPPAPPMQISGEPMEAVPPVPPPPPAPSSPPPSSSSYVVPPVQAAGFAAPPPPPPPVSSVFTDVDEKTNRKIDAWFRHHREGSITASAFAIAWSIILLIFFNFFHQYVAYYTGDTVNGAVQWTRDPFFTSDISLWLPILNTALVITIISHIVMIVIDRKLLRQALSVIMDGFALATIITLLVIWPFDFSVIPNHGVETGVNLGVSITLIIISVGIGIGLLVRFINLLVSSTKAAFKVKDY